MIRAFRSTGNRFKFSAQGPRFSASTDGVRLFGLGVFSFWGVAGRAHV